MFKKIIFQLHWLLGISAGLVLAIVGVTGGLYSFQDEILEVLNPRVLQVEPSGAARLSLDQMVAKVEAAKGARVAGLSLSESPSDPARANLLPPPGERRGQMVLFDPYTGELLGEPVGADFFMLMFKLHRWLAMGDIGKQLTGASTLALVFFCLSGLYLRWPRQALNWRTWLTLNWSRKGRAFNWDLHSVAGTWVLVVYLLAALTGLYFSYDWYRSGLTRLLSDAPAAQGPGGERRGPPGRGERGPGQGRPGMQASVTSLGAEDYQRVESALREQTGGQLASWSVRLPGAEGQPVQVTYLLDDSPHARAANMLSISPADGLVKNHQRYADKTTGTQLLQSIYPLHTGEYFGLPGRLIMMIASLIMPLFFITGWLLYLDRRRKKRALRALRGDAGQVSGDAPVLVAFASQSGFAEQQAWRCAQQLRSAGRTVQVLPVAQLDAMALAGCAQALFILSTFGDGEAPDSAQGFARKVLDERIDLGGLRYAVLGLGDRSYTQFCGFARRVEVWLADNGAQPLFDAVWVDNADSTALGQFSARLAAWVGGVVPAADTDDWPLFTLQARQLLNPGSAGEPAYLLSLGCPAACQWQAGDILQVRPQNPDAAVDAWLARCGLPAGARVDLGGKSQSLAEALRQRTLTALPAGFSASSAQALVDSLSPIAPRDYSIASVPSDGSLQLIVRQQRHADGSLGVGSGWLTEVLQPGQSLPAQVRRNSSFHSPTADCPLILVGNGTGLAGLRALLNERVQQGRQRNWLLFGERNRAQDFFCGEELQAALAAGHLQHLETAFSRDQAHKVYVQDLLREQQVRLRQWLDQGAAIYICGSEQGMAGGVDAVLRELLGAARVQELLEQGRLRRDVY